LPEESPVGFEERPECRFALAAERWLFDPPVDGATGLVSAWPFAFSPASPFPFSSEFPLDFCFGDDFSGCTGGSDLGEAVSGAGDVVVGGCSSTGSGDAVAGGDVCPGGDPPADGAWPA
jgi:hypothetical protein